MLLTDVDDVVVEVGFGAVSFFATRARRIQKKEKKKLNYDDVFHLYTIIKLENNGKTVYIRIEKQPNIVIAEQKNFLPVEKGGEMLHVVLDRPVLFANVLNIAKETMGDEYYKYSNPYNNCQTFIFNLVSAMYKLNNQTLPENLLNFILQNVEDAVKGTTRNVSNFVTNLGHFFGRIMGHGLEGGTLNEDNSIIHYYRGF